MLSIIIVTYNSSRHIQACLDSLYRNRLSFPFYVIVIDNGSGDKENTRDIVATYGRVNMVWVQNSGNLGFAKAVNQGLRHALKKGEPDFFLLLNPDAQLGAGCLETLIRNAKATPQAGLISPVIRQPSDNSVWFSNASVDWLRQKTFHTLPGKDNHPSLTAPFGLGKVPVTTGCCLLIRKELVDRIGFFDERFFLYYEDADYSVRTRQAGFSLLTVPAAVCFHDESQSSTSEIKDYHLCLSGLLFFHKHTPLLLRPYFWMLYWFRYAYHRWYSGKGAVLKALEDFKNGEAH